MTGDGDKRGETDDGVDTEGEEEEGFGREESGMSTLVDDGGFRDLAPILGSKLSGRLNLGP